MKIFKFFLSAAMLTIATAASAQFANNGGSHGGGLSLGAASTDDYSRFKVSYLVSTLSYDGSDADDSFKGVSVEYLLGKSISTSLPLFVEYGVNASWGTYSEEDDYYSDYDVNFNVVNITVPVNLAYKFSVGDGITIDPHVGVGARFNVLASASNDDDSISFFDKDDVGKSATWNRFQITGQAGVGICFNQYYLGWEYSWNFMELAKKMDLNTHYISLGINF